MYGHEPWAHTSRTKSKLQVAEIRVLRSIKGVTKLDRLGNVNIRNELDIERVLDLIERGQLRWYGHVKRMEDHRSPKQFLEWLPNSRRPVGGPRIRLRDKNKMAIEKRSSSVQEIGGQ
ncbi:uncharacterized protein [Palaemon carinicauda]|uniref:uncharacterized protein n=1 Tax=Palaemon carinicauda TaxID=392227 RepID=UPI0035B69C28